MPQRLDRYSIHQRRRSTSGFLTEREVAHCRYLMLNNLSTARQLAQDYGVSTRCMSDIRRGDTWGWVEAECMTDAAPVAAKAPQSTLTQDSPEIQASLAKLRALNVPITVIEPDTQPKAD